MNFPLIIQQNGVPKDVEPFNPTDYGEAWTAILDPSRPVAIGPGEPDTGQEPLLRELTIEKAFAGQHLRDAHAAACCISAAWLWHDFLDSSHQISQEIKTSSGSFWHAIMHRRESDYSNAKYWFGRVGKHPIYFQLLCYAQELSQTEQLEEYTKTLESNDEWNAVQFVDWCQAATNSEDNKKTFLEQLQLKELQLLIDFSCKNALI